MFNLDQKIQEFHYPVKGQCNQAPISFLARFKAYETDQEIDGMVARISGQFDADPNGLGAGMRHLAAEFFLGWTNPVDRHDLWVTQADGATPLDCTPELIEKMLDKPGVAVALCKAFQSARFDTEAQLGNSVSSRGNGFKARIQSATPG